MASNRSENLMKLAERLRVYNSPCNHPLGTSSNTMSTQILHQNESVPKKQELGIDPITSSSRRSLPNRAAVLVCLFEDQQGHFRVILTKRASTLSSYSGEVALPGGKVEEGDANDIETALREAEEEIGLDRSLVDVVAILESFTAKVKGSNFMNHIHARNCNNNNSYTRVLSNQLSKALCKTDCLFKNPKRKTSETFYQVYCRLADIECHTHVHHHHRQYNISLAYLKRSKKESNRMTEGNYSDTGCGYTLGPERIQTVNKYGRSGSNI